MKPALQPAGYIFDYLIRTARNEFFEGDAVTTSAAHVKALVKSHGTGDNQAFYSIALQVAAKAARRGHHKFASEIKELVAEAQTLPAPVSVIAQPKGEAAELLTASFPEVGLKYLVASESIVETLNQLILEQRQRRSLFESGFSPAHRLLLEGPPGTGKTMTASVLARELELPLLTIRLDSMMSKFLGETAVKMRVLFEEIKNRRAVYLFDEFDALGGDRSGNDIGEARRILNSFLLFLEQSDSDSIIVAATNHRSILDKALFRRFDMILTYELPTQEDAFRVIKLRLGTLASYVDWPQMVDHCQGLSHAELVKAAEAAAKESILQERPYVETSALIRALSTRRKVLGVKY